MNVPRVLVAHLNPAVTASPVPPYGVERVAHAFRLAGCEVRMEAPFVEEDPLAAFRQALSWVPDLVALGVRNIDDALVVRSEEGPGDIDTTFYLEEVRPLVAAALAAVGPDRVLAGGAAVSSGPEEVLAFLGLDRGIAGPADDLCWRLGRALAQGRGLDLPDDPRVVRVAGPRPRPRGFGAAWKAPPGPTPRMGPFLGLVVARGGRVPVAISTGCDRRCDFCVEARFLGFATVPRRPDEVVDEIEALARVGVRKFWLAASELNVPTDRPAIEVLRAIARRGLAVDLRGFVQPAPVSDAFLDALEAAGMDPAGLSFELGHLDDRVLRAGGGPANRSQIDRLVETWLRRGYRSLGGSVLLGGHPAETEDTLQSALGSALEIDGALPDGLGLSYATGARVYPGTGLGDWVRAHRDESAPHLYGPGAGSADLVRPVVFCRPGPPRALLARVRAGLAGSHGHMGPMNAEAPSSSDLQEAERLVDRGIWRLQQDRTGDALACFRAALTRIPHHLEALAQLAMALGNRAGDPAGAREALGLLLENLPPGDGRREEVATALAKLG